MTAINVILPDETDRLCEPDVHALDRQVFHALTLATEWDTGRVGGKHRISYARVAAHLSEDIPRKAIGSQQRVTGRQVRNSVDRLIRFGLFERISEKNADQLELVRVFWRDLVTAGKSAQNPDGRQMAATMHSLADKFDSKNKEMERSAESSRQGNGDPDGIYSYNNHHHTRARAREDSRVKLTLDWQPDHHCQQMLKFRYGADPGDRLNPDWTREFVLYWATEGVAKTPEQWARKWVKTMIQYLRNPEFFDSINGLKGAEKQTPKGRRVEPVPRNDGALLAWARKHGFRDARPGEETPAYRAELERYRAALIDGKADERKRQ